VQLVAETRHQDIEVAHGARVIEDGAGALAVARGAVDVGVKALQGLIERRWTVAVETGWP
jgi:hypothetical protein